MKSFNGSYNCLLDTTPRRVDWLVWALAYAVAIAAVWLCGLLIILKIFASILLIAMFYWQSSELRRIQRLEWQVSAQGLVRIRQYSAQKLETQPLLDARIEFIGPFVQLRGRTIGRVEYTLIWPWMIDAEQYRRLRRLQTSINQSDKEREKI